MAKALVVVESPTKQRTLGRYLGRNFIVRATVGHVMDLPKSKLGVEVGKTFEPDYVVIPGKQKYLKAIREAAEKVDTIYLASDPDREGEAIAWHVAGQIGHKPKAKTKGKTKGKTKSGAAKASSEKKIYRVLIEEITKRGVARALDAPLELNRHRFESQQARRILDRLVGYKISPILWEKVRRGLSAGRVQSVALRIVCEREKEILVFVHVEYWTVGARVRGAEPPPFELRLVTRDGKKLEIGDGDTARSIVEDLAKSEFRVSDVTTSARKRTPPPAFTTSKLQQEAARKLGFTAKKTMRTAQELYEGVEIGDEGLVGLITYMRTDSTRLSSESMTGAREWIGREYGEMYLPDKPRFYRLKAGAQDAHEAIRPTALENDPARMKGYLSEDQADLYRLIWDRFIACQMQEAVFDQTAVDVSAGPFGLRANGSVMRFDGFLRLYQEGADDQASDDDDSSILPSLSAGEVLSVDAIEPAQHFTKPPPRFTEASLVKELEDDGIGRPSTYAAILSTLTDRNYAEKEQHRFKPTELGMLVSDLLVEHFPDVVNVKFTAGMEQELDDVEEGNKDWQDVLRRFWGPFEETVKKASRKMRDVKREATPTEHKCDKCGAQMVIKWGRHGHFLACSAYPDCKNTKEFRRSEDGKHIVIVAQEPVKEICKECGSAMVVKNGRFGKFLACSRYPECKHTQSITTGVSCPEPDCTGQLTERRTRRGKVFFGCSRYPACKHASWNRPVGKACPACSAPYLVERFTKKDGAFLACARAGCGYRETAEEAPGVTSKTQE